MSWWSSCRQGSQRQNVNLVNNITLRHVCDLLPVLFTLIWFIYVKTKQRFRAVIQSVIVSRQNARSPAVLSWFKPALMKWNVTKSSFFFSIKYQYISETLKGIHQNEIHAFFFFPPALTFRCSSWCQAGLCYPSPYLIFFPLFLNSNSTFVISHFCAQMLPRSLYVLPFRLYCRPAYPPLMELLKSRYEQNLEGPGFVGAVRPPTPPPHQMRAGR